MNVELGSLMFVQLWQVTILAAAVWLAVRWYAADRPHLAHALWLLVLIKCVTPPVFASPTSPFSWLQSISRIAPTAQPMLYAETDSSALQGSHTPSDSVINGKNFLPRNESDHQSFRSSESAVELASVYEFEPISSADKNQASEFGANQLKRFALPEWLLAIWLGSAVVALFVAMTRFLLFWRCTLLSQIPTEPWLKRTVSQLAHELSLKRKVEIRIVDQPIGPAVIGLFRPYILLPAALIAGRNENDLKPLLTHELIHIRRGDLFWALIQTLAGCLFWFHPLVRLGVRMVTQESERSCDEETVANLACSPAVYARCLLNVLELKQSLRVAPAVPGIRPVDITSNRMERIMKLGHGCQKRTPFWVWFVFLACGTIVLPGAALVLGQERQDLGAAAKGSPVAMTSHAGEAGNLEKDPQLVEEGLSHTSETDLKNIVIEVFFVTAANQDTLSELGIDWRPTKAEEIAASVYAVETVGAITLMPEFQFDPKTIVDSDFQQHGSEVTLLAQNEHQNLSGIIEPLRYPNLHEIARAPNKTEDHSKPINALQRNHELPFRLMPNQECDQLKWERLKSLQDNYFLQYPTATLLSGQTVAMSDASTRPFVIGVDPIGHGNYRPRIGVVNEGTIAALTAEVQTNGSIRLGSKLIFSQLEDVRQVTLSEVRAEGNQSEPTVQLPIVSFLEFKSDIEIPQDHTLVINSYLPDARHRQNNNTSRPSLIFIRCRAIDAIELTPFHPENQITQNDQIQYFQRLPEFSNIPYLNRLQKKGEIPKFTHPGQGLPMMSSIPNPEKLIRSVEISNFNQDTQVVQVDHVQPAKVTNQIVKISSLEENPNQSSEVAIEELASLGIELHLGADVERGLNDDGLWLRGQQLIFELADFCVACQEGELELKPGGNYRFSGQGVEFGGGFESRADFAEITKKWHEQTILELLGHAEIELDKVKFTADKIKVFEDDSKIYLEGNATITQSITNDGPKSTTGKKLLYDIDKEYILVIEH